MRSFARCDSVAVLFDFRKRTRAGGVAVTIAPRRPDGNMSPALRTSIVIVGLLPKSSHSDGIAQFLDWRDAMLP
jgi:hypothetical protein